MTLGPVLRREYLERVRTRMFVLSTLGLPLFLGLILVLPALLGARDGERDRRIAVVDATGRLGAALALDLEAAGYGVTLIPDGPEVRRELDAALGDRRFGGALLLDAETLRSGRATYRSRRDPGPATVFALQGAVSRTALQVRLQDEEVPEGLEALIRGGSLDIRRIGAGPAENAVDARAGLQAGFIGAFLLYMVLILYGTAVMRSVLEEKSGRMVEIVLSALSPRDLMLGKILGVGAVGLTQLVVWLALGAAAVRFLPARFSGLSGMEAGVANVLPSSGVVALLVVFFILGYLLYASLYAAAGAVCSREEDVQQAQLPVTLILVIPVILLPGVMADPGWGVGQVLAFVPFFAPVLQFARAAGGVAAPWEVAVSLGLMALTVPLVAALAGRIYRVGILMQGKRPGLGALWRMARAG